MERGKLIEAVFKPPVAQRAGGIYILIQTYMILLSKFECSVSKKGVISAMCGFMCLVVKIRMQRVEKRHNKRNVRLHVSWCQNSDAACRKEA